MAMFNSYVSLPEGKRMCSPCLEGQTPSSSHLAAIPVEPGPTYPVFPSQEILAGSWESRCFLWFGHRIGLRNFLQETSIFKHEKTHGFL